ncbi:MAG: hypothetical protein K2M76_07400, partial [Muribaculaceae bacterium]|nr:hypothetical protein [Muribaculaceae bacterium]
MLKGLKWTLIVLLTLIFVCLTALYIPGTLNQIAQHILPDVENSTGMKISVDDIRLRFPLRLSIIDASVLYASGDSMAHIADAQLNVSIPALVRGNIDIDGDITHSFYAMGGVDSMYIRADIDKIAVTSAIMNMAFTHISIDNAVIDGGRVNLVIGTDSTTAPADTASTSQPLTIQAHNIEVHDLFYSMSMLPVIDSLGTHIGAAILTDGSVDMATRSIHAATLAIDSVDATYLTPSAEYLAAHTDTTVTETETTPQSELWTVTADKVSLLNSAATYAVAGASPLPGLDMNYLQVTGVNIDIDSLYNRGAEIRVPLRRMYADERSGIRLDASGLFVMDSTAMYARHFNILTDFSSLHLDAMMGIAAPGAPADSLPVMLDASASIGLPDIRLAYPALAPMLSAMPANTPLTAAAHIDGSLADLNLNELSIEMQRVFSASMNGNIDNATDPDHIGGHIRISGRITNPGVLRPTLRQAQLGMNLRIPPIAMSGDIHMNQGDIKGALKAVTGSGRLAMDASWTGRREAYSIDARVDSFPVRAFMPDMGIGTVTARLQASGHGFDIYSPSTQSEFELMVDHIDYDRRIYRNILLNGSLDDNTAKAELTSANRTANLSADLTATIAPDTYTWDLTGQIHHLDLEAMALMDTTMQGSLNITSSGRFNVKPQVIDAVMNISDLNWYYGAAHLVTDMIKG